MSRKNDNNPRDQNEAGSRKHGYVQLALVILFIAGAFFLSRYLAALQTAPGPERQTALREILVETVQAAPRSFRVRFSTTGTVQVRAMTDLTPQVSGRITAIDDSAFPGGFFTPETVLFQIEEKDFRLELRGREAEVARARTQLELQKASSEAAVAEWEALNPGEPVPPLVAERPQLKEAEAALEAARAGRETAKLNLSRTAFRLPFTGRITELQLEEGQYVVAGQSYGQAYRLDSLEIDVPMDDQQLDWLLEAKKPVVTIVGGHTVKPREYSGYLKRVSGRVDPQTRFSRAIFGLHEPNPDLIPGVFVAVQIIGPVRENVWTLPMDALQENESIWVVNSEGTLSSLRLEVIQITEERVVAKSNGEVIRVVRGSLPEATEGTPVRLARTDPRWEDVHGRR